MSGSSCRAAIQPLSPPPTSYQSFSPIPIPLLRAAQPVREVRRGDHMIELGRRLVPLGGPGRAAVAADGRSTIVAVDHARGIARVDPQRVMVAMGTTQRRECLAAVYRLEERRVEDVHAV